MRRPIGFIIVIAAILIAVFVIIPRNNQDKLTQTDKSPAPQFQLTWLDGSPLYSADLQGKVSVIDFWATWCGPCKQEFPEYQKLYEKYKGNPNVSLVAVNSSWNNDTVEKAQAFLQANSYNFPVAYDKGGTITRQFGVTGIPTTFILDKTGTVRAKQVGFDVSQDYVSAMSKKIDDLLAEK